MAEKVTIMVLWLKVDLQCSCCHKEVKKILAKFPREIREQKYDEKANTVTITVVCCSPEKIRDKLCCKGAKVIKCIEIKPPKKPEEPKKPEKPKDPEKVEVQVIVEPAPPPPAPVPIFVFPPAIPVKTCCGPCSDGCGRGPCCPGHGVPPPPQPCSCGCGGYGCGRVAECGYYFAEENPQTCSIM